MSAPDNFQGAAIIDIINYFGWTRFAIIASASDYGMFISLQYFIGVELSP
jgi:hypothetical protein